MGRLVNIPRRTRFPKDPFQQSIRALAKKSKSPCVRLYQLCHLMFNIWEGKYPEAFPNTRGPALQVCGENPRQGRHLTCHGGRCRPRRGPRPLTGGSGRMDFLEAGLPLRGSWIANRPNSGRHSPLAPSVPLALEPHHQTRQTSPGSLEERIRR